MSLPNGTFLLQAVSSALRCEYNNRVTPICNEDLPHWPAALLATRKGGPSRVAFLRYYDPSTSIQLLMSKLACCVSMGSSPRS